MSFRATILTLYPEMFPGHLGTSLAGKAMERGQWALDTVQIRDFATDRHRTVDDTPAGGGAGMVLKPDAPHDHRRSRPASAAQRARRDAGRLGCERNRFTANPRPAAEPPAPRFWERWPQSQPFGVPPSEAEQQQPPDREEGTLAVL